jgi:hypothetical protein
MNFSLSRNDSPHRTALGAIEAGNLEGMTRSRRFSRVSFMPQIRGTQTSADPGKDGQRRPHRRRSRGRQPRTCARPHRAVLLRQPPQRPNRARTPELADRRPEPPAMTWRLTGARKALYARGGETRAAWT